eukprot:3934023-Rhodomonas_salina.3
MGTREQSPPAKKKRWHHELDAVSWRCLVELDDERARILKGVRAHCTVELVKAFHGDCVELVEPCGVAVVHEDLGEDEGRVLHEEVHGENQAARVAGQCHAFCALVRGVLVQGDRRLPLWVGCGVLGHLFKHQRDYVPEPVL